ncbi:MAG: ferrous iron transport protein B [Candidatus Eisenbacteria bacterium]
MTPATPPVGPGVPHGSGRAIRVAIAGNPNAGKSSVFNLLTGLHQHVGNWPGVTVERKAGTIVHAGYRFEIVDLPGTYSLTAYSIEERIAREYILDAHPDVIIDVVDSANLERNLLLTAQLLEMGVDVVVDLNMWDEFIHGGAQLEIRRLEELLGTPVVTTVAHRGEGKPALLEAVIRLIEARSSRHRHVPVALGTHLEQVVCDLTARLEAARADRLGVPARYLAVKLIEGDSHIVEILHNRVPEARPVLADIVALRARVAAAAGMEPARLIMEGRHGFVSGLLREVLTRSAVDRMEVSRNLDRVLTHRYLGFPIFLAFMWLLFNGTFRLGAYPQVAIEWLIGQIAQGAGALLPAGLLKEALVDGVITGVGAVAVFMPNIMLLFLGIALLEDSGYMARAAFIMDRVMHLLGLHGKSFIPMLMGFGCSVPAIMATRMLESRRDRVLTALLVPHMSCSARLPVYVLLAGAFFARHAGKVILLIYLLGILTAVLVGRLFSRILFRQEGAPFVMELPPYRWPTGRGLAIHMWERSRHYLKKMGGVILIASVILWALSVFPRDRATPDSGPAAPGAHTIMGQVGRAISPALEPLGFDWRMTVTLLAGFVAKEVVVSSLAVLYQAEEQGVVEATEAGVDKRPGEAATESAAGGLAEILRRPEHGLTPLKAFAFMVFVLLYTPCIAAVVALRRELGTRWMAFAVGYQLVLAWVVALVVYQGGRVLGLG